MTSPAKPLVTISEPQRLGRYLIGKTISPQLEERYYKALEFKNLEIPENELPLWHYMLGRKWSIGFVDAGLAILAPKSIIRQRLLLMLAIVEATPEYSAKFLPQKRSGLYWIKIGFVGLWAGFKALFGMLIVKGMLK